MENVTLKKQKLHLEATEKYRVDFLPCQFSSLQGFNKKSGGRSKRRGSRYQREEERVRKPEDLRPPPSHFTAIFRPPPLTRSGNPAQPLVTESSRQSELRDQDHQRAHRGPPRGLLRGRGTGSPSPTASATSPWPLTSPGPPPNCLPLDTLYCCMTAVRERTTTSSS